METPEVIEIDMDVCDYCGGDVWAIHGKPITADEAKLLHPQDYWENDDGSLFIETDCCGRML